MVREEGRGEGRHQVGLNKVCRQEAGRRRAELAAVGQAELGGCNCMDRNSTVSQKTLVVGVVAAMLVQVTGMGLVAFLAVTGRFFLLCMLGVVLGLLSNAFSFLRYWKTGSRSALITSIFFTSFWIALGIFWVWMRLTALPNSPILK
jgi:hypothetical protein